MNTDIPRPEFDIISGWITPGTRVLDLGCGDGTLLKFLSADRQINGYGLDIHPEHVVASIEAGINVIQADLDAGLSDFKSNTFDYVIMTQTLQALHYPERLLKEMLRVGREGIVTFLNIGLWRYRLSLALGGVMPAIQSPQHSLSRENHAFTLRDFESLCSKLGIKILQRTIVDNNHQAGALINLFPNLFGAIALYRIGVE
ncbi:MAG: methionine biosynthesis protein MetW [Gammaproteobacteria bacterium]|nr:MAG: methionine biosynthesis protein MetW [Gammaproteobacteria bacterium]